MVHELAEELGFEPFDAGSARAGARVGAVRDALDFDGGEIRLRQKFGFKFLQRQS
jgi:predicted dinucleotide-binding enzyme